MSSTLTKLLLTFALSVLGLLFFAPPALASYPKASLGDLRSLKVAKFLRNHNSILEAYAQTYVNTADKYGLDYRLLVAIAGTESTFGRNYLAGTYNVYGWGVGQIPFTSWEDGISRVSEGLKKDYVNKGAKEIEQIGFIYCPPTYLHWSGSVRYFENEIENIDVSDILAGDNPVQKLPLTI